MLHLIANVLRNAGITGARLEIQPHQHLITALCPSPAIS
jgi:hypothetical protein